ncbi:MAG TPA: CDP-alcohol phosphatidyltransferase family protein [Candidatus Limnocylindrales bacterium]|nr:CDP-alcohol phosphatidyltransferase family protein [Candidatus Limnocylindrales bacterium]
MVFSPTVPNLLSASRIVMLPGLFLLLHLDQYPLFLVAYILVGSTDYFDGFYARKFNQVSHYGKELDSLADLLFYVSSAYFLNYLHPEVIAANQVYLITFFSLLGFSFLLSAVLFRRPVMMHTFILRWNAVMVFIIIVSSFWLDVTMLTRIVLLVYMIGFTEEMLIFILFGNVDPDTKSIVHLFAAKKSAV